MSQQQINEEQEPRNVSVVQVAPGDAAPVITKTNGRSGIPVLIAPFRGQSGGQTSAADTAQEMTMAFKGFLLLEEEEEDDPVTQRKKWFKEMRGWLMVLATVAASVTYQAGLNPPGGVWQDNDANGTHHAGDPVLRDEHHARYLTFFYFNATAFVTSLVIMVLLMSERFYFTEGKVFALFLTTIVDLASLIGAYIAGSTRYFSSCIYIIVITSVAFVAVIYIGEAMTEFCGFIMRMSPCVETLTRKRWCPIPAVVLDNVAKKKEARKQRNPNTTNNTRGCCACCAQPRVAA
ncbi:hypothetical protein QOZ80_6BG0469510 [Eleusine coracana subsp. coracana]|nr:hypothetical protein QOZ80_6BG0469510 [Eleusine coracana subsp. coracana]